MAKQYAAPKSKVDDARLRRAKKFNVATSTASGALGVGALGALAATRAPKIAPKIGMDAARAARMKRAGEQATVPLSAASLGVGGVGSLNFARVQNQEANRLPKLSDLKRKRKKVEKADRRNYNGTATGAGATLAAGGAAGTGVFQFRARNHKAYLDETREQVGLTRGTPGKRTDHYWRGVTQGQIVPERQVIRQLKNGRAISGAALVGGAGLAGAGIMRHKKQQQVSKSRKRDFAADAAVASGATAAGGAGATSMALNAQGRKWANRSSNTLRDAERLNRNIGGHTVRERPETKAGKNIRRLGPKMKTPSAFTGVPTVIPHKSNKVLLRDDRLDRVLRGRSNAEATALGRLRGAADQQRYFAGVYGQNARMLRKVGQAGAGVAAVGLGAKAAIEYRDKVRKSYVVDFGLGNVNQGVGNIEKAFYPDERRQRQLDAASFGLAAGAGVAGTSAVRSGRDAARAARSARAGRAKYGAAAAEMMGGENVNLGATRSKAAAGRRVWQAGNKTARKAGGRAAGMAALTGGLLVGADQVQRYKNGRGRPYNERQW